MVTRWAISASGWVGGRRGAAVGDVQRFRRGGRFELENCVAGDSLDRRWAAVAGVGCLLCGALGLVARGGSVAVRAGGDFVAVWAGVDASRFLRSEVWRVCGFNAYTSTD